MNDSDGNRTNLIEELIGYLANTLALYSDEQLKLLADAIERGGAAVATNGQGLRAPNDAALLVINPTASKDELLEDIEYLHREVNEQWEQIHEETEELAKISNFRRRGRSKGSDWLN